MAFPAPKLIATPYFPCPRRQKSCSENAGSPEPDKGFLGGERCPEMFTSWTTMLPSYLCRMPNDLVSAVTNSAPNRAVEKGGRPAIQPSFWSSSRNAARNVCPSGSVLGIRHQNSDPPQPAGLSCVRGERPHHYRAAKKRDETAAPHQATWRITS